MTRLWQPLSSSIAPEKPAGEVAPSLSSSGPSGTARSPFPFLAIRSLLRFAGALVYATSRRTGAFFARHFEASISVHRRGHIARRRQCPLRCKAKVHDLGEMCERQWCGLCSICGLVPLDYYGNCSSDDRAHRRNHVIADSSRRPMTIEEWRRFNRIADFKTASARSGRAAAATPSAANGGLDGAA